MPRVRRRPHARREWSHTQRVQLECGFDYFGEGFGGFRCDRPLDIDTMRACWREIGCVVLADFIEQHPGCRPYAWWCLDSPLSVLVQAQELLPDHERGAFTPWHGDYDTRWCFDPEHLGPELHDRDVRDHRHFETQGDYLDRIGELTAAEREKLEIPC